MKTFINLLCLFIGFSLITSCNSKILSPAVPEHFNNNLMQVCALSDIQLNKTVIPQANLPFAAAFSRSVEKRLLESGIINNLILERDMTSKGLGPDAYVIHYRVTDFKSIAKGGFGRNKEFEEFTVDMSIYNVSNAPIQQIKSTDYDVLVNTYNTTDISPVIKSSYTISVRSKVAVKLNKPELLVEFSRKLADDLAIQLVNASSKDIIKTLNSK